MEIKLTNGGYNMVGTKLFFDSDKGEIILDRESAFEVAITLVDCLNLDYHTATIQDVEEKIFAED